MSNLTELTKDIERILESEHTTKSDLRKLSDILDHMRQATDNKKLGKVCADSREPKALNRVKHFELTVAAHVQAAYEIAHSDDGQD